MNFIRTHQLSVMLFLSGSLGILMVMTLLPKFMSYKRRSILALMEFASMMLLIFDRLSYLYRGDVSNYGGFMVRLSNGMCYFLMLLIPLLVTYFMEDLYRDEGKLEKTPMGIRICEVLFVIGTVLIIVSQFNGLYYTFDDQNRYVRAPGNIISYIIPFLVVIIQESVILKYRGRLNRNLETALMLSIIMPTIAAVIQFFCYGISLMSITTVVVVIVFYVYTLSSLGEEVGNARTREIEFYKRAQEREAVLFEETTAALANAIDAKDKYTRGHSARVATISRMIAKEAGFSDEECSEVFFSALLHDVGKIGVPDTVINKPGKLTDEEFEQMKKHPVLGAQILSSIKQSPYLSIGAHYHHERYDGDGYPDGLAGENIPEYARIITVADSYDAMTSTRSYRNALSKEKVRREFANEMGKQFDYKYSAIILKLMDSGQLDPLYDSRDEKLSEVQKESE
ncbi:MAG: HD-GYP domain-containing protein [Solobacterium sp.]|nr:HD-GYP domain-containing protein [Solobacterium sp.]